mmetsp:Transcript_13451/g.56501  ORF Transcript_13451/g.56501 Transcript_13451/m.56501 type:complete len:315 (-) Transcript_13451:168-1112(-)
MAGDPRRSGEPSFPPNPATLERALSVPSPPVPRALSSHISFTSTTKSDTLMHPATPKSTHAVSSQPGCSSKQKNTPPTAQTHSMTNDQKSTRRFLSYTEGGGLCTDALYADNVIFLSARNKPTPTGNRKKEIAQMMFAKLRMKSNSLSSSRRYITRFTVGEYISDPTMPIASPSALSNVPTNVYSPLHAGSNSFNFSSSAPPMHAGSAKPRPHNTYPAVHKNAVGSQPCVRYVRPPHANRSRPVLTQSSMVIRLDAGSSNKSEPSSDPARGGMSTLSYVGFAGAIARGEATTGHARSPSSPPREARKINPVAGC